MKIKVTAFGVARDIIGASDIELVSEKGLLTVKTLKALLNNKYEGLAALQQYLIAVDESYARDETEIHGDEEIVIIPPVSGG